MRRTPLKHWPALWDARHGADVVIASRYVPESGAAQPPMRHILSRTMNRAFSRVLATPIADLSSGFRLYRRRVFQASPPGAESLAFLLETLLLFLANGFRVKEIPYHGRLRQYRRAQAHGWRLGIECLFGLFRLWRMRNSVQCADYDYRAYDSRIPLQRYWQRKRCRILMDYAAGPGPTLDVGCGSGSRH